MHPCQGALDIRNAAKDHRDCDVREACLATKKLADRCKEVHNKLEKVLGTVLKGLGEGVTAPGLLVDCEQGYGRAKLCLQVPSGPRQGSHRRE